LHNKSRGETGKDIRTTVCGDNKTLIKSKESREFSAYGF